eukprot:3106942-Karenia_brevis.AAC.1
MTTLDFLDDGQQKLGEDYLCDDLLWAENNSPPVGFGIRHLIPEESVLQGIHRAAATLHAR